MHASILVKDLLYRISVQLHDIDPQFLRWTQKELVMWLNDGQRAIAKYLPASCARVDSVKLVDGTLQNVEYIPAARLKTTDGSASTSVYSNGVISVIRNKGSDGETPGRAIRIVDREVLDSVDPDWHTKTGLVVMQYVYDPNAPSNFYVSPGVAVGADVWVEMSYLADPTDIAQGGSYEMGGTDTTTLNIDDRYVDDLMNYILARAYQKDAEFASNGGLGGQYAQMFVGSINSQAVAMTGVNPNLRALPGSLNIPNQTTVA